MRREERRAIMGQGVVLPETPRERRQREGLAQDVADSPLKGRRLDMRLRNFTPATDGYLLSLGGPLPYMLRLREIDVLTAAHESLLRDEWRDLADTVPPSRFPAAWAGRVSRWSFDDVNELIARHNRWYPAEARLPMDPVTGDYAHVNGEDYRRELLDEVWALKRFPADHSAVASDGRATAVSPSSRHEPATHGT